jgi:hypothetical protein
MSCPVLSEISTAEFEARAKVDLSVRTARGGELEVVCDNLAARVRWRERGRAWVARAMPPAATPATLIDALLVASKELVEEATRLEGAKTADRATEQGGASEAMQPMGADLSDPTEAERAPDRARQTSRTGDAAGNRAATPESGMPWRDRPGSMAATPLEWAWGVSAGTQAALFKLEGKGMAGASLGAFLSLPMGLVATLTGEYDLGLGAGDVVSVRMAAAIVTIAARFGPARAFEVGAGGLAGSVFVTSEGPYQPTSDSLGFWGAIVRGRYALGRDAWRFAIGPDVRFHGFRPEIAVDQATVWGVPLVSVGVALEVSRELYGSR